ncbi:glycosyltransferase [Corynebacterium sp. HMSC072A02]|uniref:glycosyltransferase n=1 Tax=Corynebacterium sp. HMSC072A02 TaxID=1715177 RepID=UPI000AD25125|nr:glycosyltransferase [Corynebacterium sp. HMSC072A02]
MPTVDVSFVVPCYNAERKMQCCLESLESLSRSGVKIEAIFVDDCSTDHTRERLDEFCSGRGSGWAVAATTSSNSGSPSEPRNLGMSLATGEYIYFLDVDDGLIQAGFLKALEIARIHDADVVRAPLMRREEGSERLFNELRWNDSVARKDAIANIIRYQSTTVGGLIKRELIKSNSLSWRSDLRMGEDTLFLCSVLKVAETICYSPDPDYLYNVKRVEGSASSTQMYDDRELENHLEVWREAEKLLKSIGLSYFSLRGKVALQTVMLNLIHVNRGGVCERLFLQLRDFLKTHKKTVNGFRYNDRLSRVLSLILSGKYSLFLEEIKERLLVAGYDLKFIEKSFPKLKRFYQLKVDRWSGHDRHDEAESRKLLEWAEVIHCEWLLGNAVWYSENKRQGQKLIVRCHLFEMTRDFGDRIRVGAVDRFVVVSLPTLEDFVERFDLPRARTRLMPNFLDVDSYEKGEGEDRCFNLGMVGILPARKGFHRAIELLQQLQWVDDRYKLVVFGKTVEDVDWVANNPVEKEYFDRCESLISSYGLSDKVEYRGWQDMRSAISEIGFLLSMSDFESFHVAPAEAFAAGNAALFLPWRGVEFIYPSKYIVESIGQMLDSIVSANTSEAIEDFATEGRDWVRNNFDVEKFVIEYDRMVLNI